MSCLNCQCTEIKMNKALQLFVCQECGLIQVSRIFEHRDNMPVKREMIELTLLCSEFGIEEVEEVKKILRSTYVHLMYSRYTMAELSVASLYLHQRLNKEHPNLLRYCRFFGLKRRRVNRIVTRLEKHFEVITMYTLQEAEELCVKQNFDCFEIIKKTATVMTLDKHTIAGCIYVGTELSLAKVARFFNISTETVYRASNRIKEMIE